MDRDRDRDGRAPSVWPGGCAGPEAKKTTLQRRREATREVNYRDFLASLDGLSGVEARRAIVMTALVVIVGGRGLGPDE
jgi:hypothetical protein